MRDARSRIPSRHRTLVLAAGVVMIGILAVFGAAEFVARLLEPIAGIQGTVHHEIHPELGWLPAAGRMTYATSEFSIDDEINASGMNDEPLPDDIDRVGLRIAALGDSHTFAVGVSQHESWPNQLEEILFDDEAEGSVYNLGVVGYGVGQYALRYRQMAQVLRPHVVVIGFSMATDLYDLVPPGRGGFVYGGDKGRVYFDLDADGALVEKRDLVARTLPLQAGTASSTLRVYLENLALYRRFKRSQLGLWIAMHFRPGGGSLWPGMDTALKRELDADDTYRWKLAGEILKSLAREVREDGARAVVLLAIPYLPQVYDEIWESSFGLDPERYDRQIASARLSTLCEEAGVLCVDTTPRFAEEVKRRGRWLHFPQDAHPDPEGQTLIAEVLADALSARGIVE